MTDASPAAGETTAFLHRLYAERDEDDAIDAVYDTLAELLASGDVDDCDAILSGLDIGRITPAVAASVLTVTAGARTVLSNRAGFFDRVSQHFEATLGVEMARRFLVGLA